MRRVVTALATVTLVVISALGPLPAPASAAAIDEMPATLYVATDGDDTSLCTASDAPCLTVSGAVSRAQAAITDGAVDVTVHIAAGTYNENVAIGAVASGHSVSLIGAGASTTIIDASTSASVITVASGIVNIGSLSVTGGYAQSGGGIHNTEGTLTISEAAVTGNTATAPATLTGGGGIYNGNGTMTIADSTVSGNTATASGASNDKSGGGGIYNATGTLTISDSAVSGNTTTSVTGSFKGGGGIYNATGTLNILHSGVTNNTVTGGGGYGGGVFGIEGGNVTISDSTVSNNTSTYYVGGINNRGLLTISRSTVSDNTAEKNFGGGISNYGGTLVLSDSTLSGNSAPGANTGKGGAIYNRGPATVINSTLYGNSATFGGGISNLGSGALTVTNSTLSGNTATRDGGGFRWEGGTMAFSNSIVSASSCSANSAIIDGGFNVSDNCTFHVPSGTSITGSTTIGLAPLAANGSTGPQTMAIDSTSSAHHLVPGCTGTDARGLGRPGFGGTANCDAGAYELQAEAPAVTTHPQSQTLAIGSDAAFTSAASGAPTPTVQWQANTGTAWADVPGATSTTLTVAGVTHAMSGTRYRAVFTNGVVTDATTAAATLTVPVGVLDHVVLSPSSGTFVAGGSRAFTAEGFDSFGNSLGDVTAATVFTGSAGVTCTDASCTATVPGTYTVTGTDGAVSGTATVTVTVGALDYVVLSPSSGTFVAGGSRAFTAEGFDSFGNSLGDVTAATVFTGSAGVTCTDASCTATVPGTYTVTGTDGAATGSASVTVEALPEVHLPTNRPVASGPLTGVPATIQPGARFTATATGFAPHAPVTFGIYSTPLMLGSAIADSNGTAVAHLQIPAGFAGSHTVVAAGMSPSLAVMYLEISVLVVPPAGPASAELDPQLAITGIDSNNLNRLGAMGFLLLMLGSLISGAASRRHRMTGRTPTGPVADT